MLIKFLQCLSSSIKYFNLFQVLWNMRLFGTSGVLVVCTCTKVGFLFLSFCIGQVDTIGERWCRDRGGGAQGRCHLIWYWKAINVYAAQSAVLCQILAATLRGSILTKVGRWLRAMIRDVLTWRGGEVTRHNTGIVWVGGGGGAHWALVWFIKS